MKILNTIGPPGLPAHTEAVQTRSPRAANVLLFALFGYVTPYNPYSHERIGGETRGGGVK